MLKNYFKIALRNLRKRATTSIIAISSLTIGLAVCFIIGLYVLQELSYDRFVPDASRIVRIIKGTDGSYQAESPPGLAHALETKLPGIKTLTEINNYGKVLITHGQESLHVDNVLMADSNMAKIFPMTALAGDVQASFNQPNKIILSESTARRIFKKQHAVGQVLTVEIYPGYTFDYEVGAVVKDPPANLHFTFKALLSLSQKFERQSRYSQTIQWSYAGAYVYCKLQTGLDLASFQRSLSSLEKRLGKPKQWSGQTYLKAQPLTAIHLEKKVVNEMVPQGDMQYLYIFSVIGLLILGIACFNYMNLSTARALPRAGEVGMRKVLGASRSSLIFQFLAEAILTSLIAFPLALVVTEMSLPLIHQFTGEQFTYGLVHYPLILCTALGIVVLAGLLSGLYPALVISSYQPSTIFGKWGKGGNKASMLQKSLLVLQFGIAVLFLISTLVITRQMQFIQHTKLGFNKERVVYFESAPLKNHFDAFKQQLSNKASVVNVSEGLPPGIGFKNMTTSVKDSSGVKRNLNIMQVADGYLKTMDIKLLAGREFSSEYSDGKQRTVIINLLAADQFNLGKDAVGKTVRISGKDMQVIGIMEDFHNESLKDRMQPVALMKDASLVAGVSFGKPPVVVRFGKGQIQQGIKDLQAAWSSFLPGRPLEFTFLDQKIDAQYRAEQKEAALISIFTGIAILIACIGLLGLASLMIQNRTKEIGVRKVLGATVANIVSLLSKDFLKLVVMGFVLAVPIAWYAMQQWLANFAYKITIGPGIFLLAGGLALLIALATVSWQSTKAALANPVDSLRSE